MVKGAPLNKYPEILLGTFRRDLIGQLNASPPCVDRLNMIKQKSDSQAY